MTRTRRRDVAASVRDRLLNLSRERGEDFQLILTRYAVERLLYRLSVSRYRDQFLLKGAMLFLVWTGQIYRPTRDLDLLGRGENDVASLEGVFREICKMSVENDGLEFPGDEIRGERIRENEDYEGVRLGLTAELARAEIPLQVDVAFGDVVKPGPEEAEYPTLLGFSAPRLKIYPREAVVAEKFQIMVALGIANSRVKDFSDIWTLAQDHRFDGQTLRDAIAATFTRHRTPLLTAPPLALTAEFSEDRAKRTQWEAFARRGRLEVGKFALSDVVGLLRDFLMPPTIAAAAGESFHMGWPPGGPWQPSADERRR